MTADQDLADSLTATFVADSVRRGLAVVDAGQCSVQPWDLSAVVPGRVNRIRFASCRSAEAGAQRRTTYLGHGNRPDLESGDRRRRSVRRPPVDDVRRPLRPHRQRQEQPGYDLTEDGATLSGTYFYIVQACNTSTDVCGTASPEAFATAPILAPTGLAAAVIVDTVPVIQDTVNLTWTVKPGVFYQVTRATVVGSVTGPYAPVGAPTAAPPAFPFEDATVAPATIYSYKVQACSTPTICSLFSSAAKATTP